MTSEDRPPRIAFNLTSARVQYYGDVVEYMASSAIERYKAKYGQMPSQEQIAFLKKEITRYAIIRHDIDTAGKLEIGKSNVLMECSG